MGMTPKENYLNCLNHKPYEWAPVDIVDTALVGFAAGPGPWIEKGPIGGGVDGFGVRWISPSSGGGAPIPAPNEFLLDLDNITDWKNIIKFPDLEAFEWEIEAAKELEGIDRNMKAVVFGCGNGVFERLAAFMGFEECLMALLEEPEACNELMEALTDYKIEFAKKVAKYYKADAFINFEDVATERGLFMSPETYRKLIKPHHKRLYDAVKELGMIPLQHTCGNAQMLIEDFIEIGVAGWTSLQPTNDIVQMQKNYGDKIVFIGGFDSNGKVAAPDTPIEDVLAEVHRVFDTYAVGGSFVFFGFLLVDSLDPKVIGAKMMPMLQEAAAYSHKLAGRF